MTQLDNALNGGVVAAEARRKIRLRPIALKVHRWAALAAMLWLIVLGLTGFSLNHPQWRWLQQVTVTEAFASKHVLQDEARGTIIRKFQVNHAAPGEMLGEAGEDFGAARTAVSAGLPCRIQRPKARRSCSSWCLTAVSPGTRSISPPTTVFGWSTEPAGLRCRWLCQDSVSPIWRGAPGHSAARGCGGSQRTVPIESGRRRLRDMAGQ